MANAVKKSSAPSQSERELIAEVLRPFVMPYVAGRHERAETPEDDQAWIGLKMGDRFRLAVAVGASESEDIASLPAGPPLEARPSGTFLNRLRELEAKSIELFGPRRLRAEIFPERPVETGEAANWREFLGSLLHPYLAPRVHGRHERAERPEDDEAWIGLKMSDEFRLGVAVGCSDAEQIANLPAGPPLEARPGRSFLEELELIEGRREEIFGGGILHELIESRK